jgi:hypothetical protein
MPVRRETTGRSEITACYCWRGVSNYLAHFDRILDTRADKLPRWAKHLEAARADPRWPSHVHDTTSLTSEELVRHLLSVSRRRSAGRGLRRFGFESGW